MSVISNATVYLLTGLIILSYAIQSSRAAPKGFLKKPFVSAEKSDADDGSTNELDLDGKNKPTHSVKPSSVGIWPTSSTLRDIMLSPSPVQSLLDNGMDKATTFLIGANNFLNGNSNIDPIDRFNSNFNTLFTSTGTSAVNNYYNIFANFWVNFDAITQFVRGMENRLVVRRVTAAAEAKDEEESNAIVQKALLSLTAVNAQLEALKKNLNNSLRRQGIAIPVNRRTAKSKRVGVYSKDDEEEQEEYVNNSLRNQFDSSADRMMKTKYETTEYNDDSNDIDLSDI